MDYVLIGLQLIAGLISLGCFLLVLYVMYDNSESTMLVICLLGVCLAGIGGLIVFVYGWTKATEWDIAWIMKIWTGAAVASIAITVIRFALR